MQCVLYEIIIENSGFVLQKYLDLPEFHLESDESLLCSHDSVLAIKDGSFAWENEDDDEAAEPVAEAQPRRRRRKSNKKGKAVNGTAVPEPEPEAQALQSPKELNDCLHLIQLEVKRGSLVGVCGSGKNQFLA